MESGEGAHSIPQHCSPYFARRDKAEEDLCEVHRAVFVGASCPQRTDLWAIALVSNEPRMGKTAFGLNYNRRCREQRPKNVDSSGGFQESLLACRTLWFVFDYSAFNEAEAFHRPNPTSVVMVEKSNKAIAKAVIIELDRRDGANLSDYISSPQAHSCTELVESIVEDLGPMFIAMDSIGRPFNCDTDTRTDDEKMPCRLFLEFCSCISMSWI